MAEAVTLRVFGPLRDVVGAQTTILRAGTVREAVSEAKARYGPSFAAILATSRIWLNGEPVGLDVALREGDELAFFAAELGRLTDQQDKDPLARRDTRPVRQDGERVR